MLNKNNIIEMNGVGIRYDQGPEILSDIKLSLPKGSFHFLTGQSGAGKTSLLSLMYLTQRPSRGQMSVFNHNLSFTNRDQLASLRRRIGVVFQDFRLIEHLSAFLPVRLQHGRTAFVPHSIHGMTKRRSCPFYFLLARFHRTSAGSAGQVRW